MPAFQQAESHLSVKSKTSEGTHRLSEILHHRQKETEETSLKFSNLSQEEIVLWKEGRPSQKLSYELSFWNDFAKWMMLIQEKGERYQISFEYSQKKIPNQVNIDFPDIAFSFYISEANLPEIIPALTHLKSPLVVHNAPQELIEKISYDKESGTLIVEPKAGALSVQKVKELGLGKYGIALPGWFYVADDGFYPRERHSLLEGKVLSGKQISQALDEHFAVIKHLLKGAILHENPVYERIIRSLLTKSGIYIFLHMFLLQEIFPSHILVILAIGLT